MFPDLPGPFDGSGRTHSRHTSLAPCRHATWYGEAAKPTAQGPSTSSPTTG
jgi:hypothetical protein